jgi:hypothetical protein
MRDASGFADRGCPPIFAGATRPGSACGEDDHAREDLATNAAFEAQLCSTRASPPPARRATNCSTRSATAAWLVYRARDTALVRDVAVKLLAERYPPDTPLLVLRKMKEHPDKGAETNNQPLKQ